jgi:hypothetical protein
VTWQIFILRPKINPCIHFGQNSEYLVCGVCCFKMGIHSPWNLWWITDTRSLFYPSPSVLPDYQMFKTIKKFIPLSPELNPICYLLALLAHDFLHVSRIRVKSLTLRLLMFYIHVYGAPILDVSRSHTTTQHSR